MFRATLMTVAIALSACTATPTEPESPKGIDTAELSTVTRAQDDFFAYVNERWIAANPIPDEYTAYGVGRVVFDRTEAQVHKLVEQAQGNTQDADAQRIGALYTAFMDEAGVEAAGLEAMQPLFEQIDAIADHDGVWRAFGGLQPQGVSVPVAFYNDADAADPEVVRLYLWQSGLGLPDRDYYLEPDDKLAQAREDYRAHIANLYALVGWPDGAAAADAILALETKLAEAQWSRVQNRDRQRIYTNKFTSDEADALTPGLSWNAFLAAADIPAQPLFILAQDTYFAALSELLRAHDVATWRAYLKLHTLKTFAPYLTQAIVEENFDFEGRKLRGQQAQRPRWKRGIALVNSAAGELLGKLYVAEHFPADAKRKINTLVENLRTAFGESIDNLDWMSAPTKAQAREKLAAFTAKLGYPDRWRDYAGLEVTEDDLLGNVMRANAFNYAHEVAKLSAPTDRSEWGMTPQTVNAYYRPTFNEIVFPAAILQPPFFDASADDALNYGAIGAIIGHEFSHGFDDQGRKFDGNGRLRDWWQPADAQGYEFRAAALVAQYDAYQPLPDTPINGKLTLGENIADLAGIIMAHRAYRLSLREQPAPIIDGLTGDQRFFISYALAWRGHMRDERLREILLSDPHSPGEYRVLGIVKNVPEFYEAFNVRPGDGMYLPPEERVKVW